MDESTAERIAKLGTAVERHVARGGRAMTERVTFADLVELEKDGTLNVGGDRATAKPASVPSGAVVEEAAAPKRKRSRR